MRISDWSSDVCSSDLRHRPLGRRAARVRQAWGGVGSVCGGVQIRSLFGKSRKSDFQSRTGKIPHPTSQVIILAWEVGGGSGPGRPYDQKAGGWNGEE